MTSLLSGSLARTISAAASPFFLDATLTRDGATTGSSFDPIAGSPTNYTCKAIRDTYSVGQIAGGLVQATDVKIIILQQTLSVTPRPGDRITITGMGGPWSIVPENASGQRAVTADPANATWECRASA